MKIEKMQACHKQTILRMMETFYRSPAVSTDGSPEIFARDIDACIENSPYLTGYVLLDDTTIAGYAMVAKSFSTEFGKPCLWIEDLYLDENYRKKGLGNLLLSHVLKQDSDCVFRLEVEEENTSAVRLYEKLGFTRLPYVEMICK